ncbi:MAG: radical SAM protein [Candidatus Omnitrophota bacterium]|nr:radical SAM protein [Candidatus Omnitrophota bacterium]
MKKKVYLTTNGCKRREIDISRITDYFKRNEYAIISDPRKADYIVFVTCSFIKLKENECIERIKEFLKYKGKLIVAGCLPGIAPERLKEIFSGDVIVTRNLEKIDEIFCNLPLRFDQIPDANFFCTIGRPFDKFVLNINPNINFFKKSLRYLSDSFYSLYRGLFYGEKVLPACLRIGWGCIENCSYCNIRNAVGKLKSKIIDELVEEYKSLLEKKYRYFYFTADNLGLYGLDIKSNLPELINALSLVDRGIPVRWFFDQLHPRWIKKYEDFLCKQVSENRFTHISVPIQSGSNRILTLMSRHHTIDEVSEILIKFRRLDKKIILLSHVIIGFPSETEEDFMATLDALRLIKFDFVSLYPYYDSYGSVASQMPDKIDFSTIERRMKIAGDTLRKDGILFSYCNF